MENLGKLQLAHSGLYKIEVNDAGETITIDAEDIELPLKLNKMIEDCEKIEKQVNLQSKVIDKKEVKQKGLITNIDEEYVKLYRKSYIELRKAIDGFLGDGACQKIFGDRNYLSMWKDLLEALNPHLQKITVLQKDTKDIIAEKYGDNSGDVLE